MFQVILVTIVSVLGVIAIMALGAYFFLLTKPATFPGKDGKGGKGSWIGAPPRLADETPSIEGCEWINDLLIQWLGIMLLTGSTRSPQVLSDRVSYFLTLGLDGGSSRKAIARQEVASSENPSDSDSQHNFTQTNPSSSQSSTQQVKSIGTTPSTLLNANGFGSGTNPFGSRASSRGRSLRGESQYSQSTHSVGSGSKKPQPRLRGLRLGSGPSGSPKVPQIGDIGSAVTLPVTDQPVEDGRKETPLTVGMIIQNQRKLSKQSNTKYSPDKNRTKTRPPVASSVASLGQAGDFRRKSFHFRIPFSYDDLALDAVLDCEIPLFMGLGSLVAADLATVHTELEIRTVRLDAVLNVTIEDYNTISVGFESRPKWESKICTKFGSAKTQSVGGGSKVEEIVKLAINRVLDSMVVPHGGFVYDAASKKWGKKNKGRPRKEGGGAPGSQSARTSSNPPQSQILS